MAEQQSSREPNIDRARAMFSDGTHETYRALVRAVYDSMDNERASWVVRLIRAYADARIVEETMPRGFDEPQGGRQ